MATPPATPASTRAWPLWPVPVVVALLPFVAAHLAYALSIDAGYVPACMPYLEGCTSISRAARYGLGNHLFRLVMLPSALLLALHWLAMRTLLRDMTGAAHAGRSLLLLAPLAGIALATYVAFLGTDGEVYRWLRQYGAQGYFASVYMAQLVFVHRYRQWPMHRTGVVRGMAGIGVAMLALGIGYTAAANFLPDPAAKDRWENLLEWHIGLLMTAWYLLQARVVRDARLGFSVRKLP